MSRRVDHRPRADGRALASASGGPAIGSAKPQPGTVLVPDQLVTSLLTRKQPVFGAPSAIILCASTNIKLAFDALFPPSLRVPEGSSSTGTAFVYWDSVCIAIACKYILSLSGKVAYSAPQIDKLMNLILYSLFSVSPTKKAPPFEDTVDPSTVNSRNPIEEKLAEAVRLERWIVNAAFMCISKASSPQTFANLCRRFQLPSYSFQTQWIDSLVASRQQWYADRGIRSDMLEGVWKASDSEVSAFFKAAQLASRRLNSRAYIEDKDKLLGEGSFGTVYVAFDPSSCVVLAIKRLIRRSNTSQRARNHVSTEVTREIFVWYLLARNGPPSNYIAAIENVQFSLEEDFIDEQYSSFVTDITFVAPLGVPFEVLARQCHAAFQPQQPEGAPVAAMHQWFKRFLCQSLCHALLGIAHMQALGVLHVDIKPGNVLFNTQTGYMQLTDFGSSIPHNQEIYATELSAWNQDKKKTEYDLAIAFTPLYAPPEIVIGGAGPRYPVHERCDIWSIGMMAASMFTPSFGFNLFGKLPPPNNLIAITKFVMRTAALLTNETPSETSSLFDYNLTQYVLKREALSQFREELVDSQERREIVSVYKNYLGDETAQRLLVFLSSGCLAWEPDQRLSPRSLLDMAFLKEVLKEGGLAPRDVIRFPEDTQDIATLEDKLLKTRTKYFWLKDDA